MLRISQLKIRTGHTEEELIKKLLHLLHIKKEELRSYTVRRRSVDARKKPELFYVYTIDVDVKREAVVLRAGKKRKGPAEIALCTEKAYQFPKGGTQTMKERPIVVGSGPAGLFCAYFLAEHGYRPILMEQGAPVEVRQKDVEEFWSTGRLDPFSNVQFGEGGAGTFSDGKLNTLVKDVDGRIKKVLELFVENGAPKEILYDSKPHIGTDILIKVVKNIRSRITDLGGEVKFYTKLIDITMEEGGSSLTGIYVQNIRTSAEPEWIAAENLVLALGHSARDTFEMLYEKQIPMEAKSFAVGVRIEHPQELINLSQYGQKEPDGLGAAPYKLTARLPDGRGVYSFCMCPGGYVVNASSEEGHLAVNGMSYHARNSKNANSAIVVTVTPDDFKSDHPLAGIRFQRELERAAWQIGEGQIPVQRLEDFLLDQKTDDSAADEGAFLPCMKGRYRFANLRPLFPEFVAESLMDGIKKFDAKISGFSSPDALLSGVESRTSSPVRIVRENTMESRLGGLYPCGEGAGYAGGITSAAVDGLKTAEAIRRKYAPFDKTTQGLRKI